MVRKSFFLFAAFLVLITQSPWVCFCQTGAPAPLVYLPFDEGSGTTTLNQGTVGGTGTFVSAAEFDTFIPEGEYAPTSNASSLNLGDGIETALGSGVTFPFDPMIGLTQFTITAWVYPTTEDYGPGGNRIFTTWQRGDEGTPNRRQWNWYGSTSSINFLLIRRQTGTDLYVGPYSGWDFVFRLRLAICRDL